MHATIFKQAVYITFTGAPSRQGKMFEGVQIDYKINTNSCFTIKYLVSTGTLWFITYTELIITDFIHTHLWQVKTLN